MMILNLFILFREIDFFVRPNVLTDPPFIEYD